MSIAVVGSGISGLSAAWLLAKQHDVTLYERDQRLGGHSNTVAATAPEGLVPIDTGFIVYNPLNYPNLTKLFEHVGVETAPSDMSFAVSLEGGALEYGGGTIGSLFAQRRNIVNPRFWFMLSELLRFYKSAPAALHNGLDDRTTLGEFLKRNRYGRSFINDHLLPMAGAIWSSSPETLAQYPIASFIRFFENHGLLKLSERPPWRTVQGGSRTYVEKLAATITSKRIGAPVRAVTRNNGRVQIIADGETRIYDRVLIATHADEALHILVDASVRERSLLSPFGYTKNYAVLHTDPKLMPRRKGVWSSWNYLGTRRHNRGNLCLTYWMNRLQPLPTATQFFVTLNPAIGPAEDKIVSTHTYEHPVFTIEAVKAQRELHTLQGDRNTWFAGAYFGSGFHEDGLRSGLAAAEELGGVVRPWTSAGQTASTPARLEAAA